MNEIDYCPSSLRSLLFTDIYRHLPTSWRLPMINLDPKLAQIHHILSTLGTQLALAQSGGTLLDRCSARLFYRTSDANKESEAASEISQRFRLSFSPSTVNSPYVYRLVKNFRYQVALTGLSPQCAKARPQMFSK